MERLPDPPAAPVGGDPTYGELLRRPDLSIGRFTMPPGTVDRQEPHTEDELYVVERGRGTLRTADGDVLLEPGRAVFVPAGEPHRFVDVTEELSVLVVFGPAEGTRTAPR